MKGRKILSHVFLLLLIATTLSFIYSQYKAIEDEKAITTYKEVFYENSDISKPINPVIISEPVIEEKPLVINNKPFTIRDNKNTTLLNDIEDYTGWIKIDNTKIDYPVVKGKDNQFYLDHNYKKEKSDAGAIFMDRRNLGNKYDKHTIIYGHNMRNGSMFKDLNKYLNESFFNNNALITFEDLYKDYKYQVISAYYISADLETIAFEINEETIHSFIKRSLHSSDYEYDENDRFLTLATCNSILDNGRMVVHAVLVE